MRVIITGARTPFALHMSRLFHAAGHEVILTDSQRFSLGRFTRMKARFVRTASCRFEPERYGAEIRELIAEWQADLVVPTCEEVFYLSRLLAGTPEGELLFAPPFELLAQMHDKARFAEMADSLGAGAGQNLVLADQQSIERFQHDPRDFVFKPVWSRFASRILIAPQREALSTIHPTPETPWLAQTRVSGEEFCVYAVAHRGRLVACSPYRNLMRAGAGTAICYEPIDAPDIADFCARFAEMTGWHGQVSFDFIRTPEGRLVAIECNPRATSGLSLFHPDDGAVDAIVAGTPARPASRGRLGIKGTILLVGLLGLIGLQPRQRYLQRFFSSRDALAFPGEWSLLHGQAISVGEIWLLSLRKNLSILEATTYDMEWNGEGLTESRVTERSALLT
jgi:hypothetical protein